jgi:Raf kinase inhibitor-like YbhB/YbcL family protein
MLACDRGRTTGSRSKARLIRMSSPASPTCPRFSGKLRRMPKSPHAFLFLIAVSFCGDAIAQTPQILTVTSPTMKAGEPIPRDHTADGKNVSPALMWANVPAGTREFALIVDDPDAPTPQPFVHWVIYKIPGTAKGLPENIPIDAATPMPHEVAGAVQGMSGFRRPIYRGPAPPPGKVHNYHFTVYALDTAVDLQPGATKQQLLDAMKGHVIGQGELVATYERKQPMLI